jgi:HPt (histidine-containing phosphotransfer) domain-containing protein
MDGYLSKPLVLSELYAALAKLDADEFAASDEVVAAPERAAVIDSARIDQLRDLEQMSGSPVVSTVARAFLDDAPSRMEAIRSAVTIGDAEAARTAAHTLKGASANLGATHLSELCFSIERTSAAIDRDAIAQLERELERVLEAASVLAVVPARSSGA